MLFFVWLLFIARVLADVGITSPASGQSYSGSGSTVSIDVKWNDDGASDDTALSGVSKYAIKLCSGPNNNIQAVKTFSTSVSKSATSYTVEIESSSLPNGIYFIQVYAEFGSGYTIHYSPRFSLTGMSGTSAAITFAQSFLSVTGTNPSPQTAVGGANQGDPAVTWSKSHTIAYVSQTGKTRYAPMQTQPGKSISYSTWSNRHPTSAYTPYTSVSPSPNCWSTVTAGWDYQVTSSFNTAPVAAYPTHYYPASQRVQQASLTQRKKRWV